MSKRRWRLANGNFDFINKNAIIVFIEQLMSRRIAIQVLFSTLCKASVVNHFFYCFIADWLNKIYGTQIGDSGSIESVLSRPTDPHFAEVEV